MPWAHDAEPPGLCRAYVYGRTRKERYLDPGGALRQRSRRLPRDQWEVLIPDHPPGSPTGTPTWPTRPASALTSGRRPASWAPAVREGCALLQGLATCGTCGRKLTIFYAGPAKCVPNYYCQGSAELVNGRGAQHMSVGRQDRRHRRRRVPGRAGPAAPDACLQAARQLEDGHDAALAQHQRQVEQAPYHAARAERRYRAVDPDNRLVACGLETEWEHALRELPTPRPNWPAARPRAQNPDRAGTGRDPGPRR
jgi:hypothetical protein